MTRAPAADAEPHAHRTHATGRERLLGHLAMLLFATLIAGSFSLGSLAAPHIESAPLNATRFLIGAVIMGAFAFGIQRYPFRLPEAPWRYLVFGALMGTYFVTMFIALGITSPVSTSAVFTLMPLITAGLAFLLMRQRAGPIVLVSLALAGLGSIWVIFDGSLAAILAFDIGRGELIFFVGVIGHAFYATLLRRFGRGEPSVLVSFWVLVGTAFCITTYGFPQILSTDWTALPPIVWLTLAYLAIATSGITFFLVAYASARLPAAKVTAYSYLTPGFVILIEGLSGRGWGGLSVLAGALVTVLGLLVLYFSSDA